MTELILAEKPDAASKIAEALSDGKPEKHIYKKVPYYEITHKNKKIFVCSAVGHLFGLYEKDKKAWTYPVFSYEWVPIYKSSKLAAFTKPYIDLLKKLGKEADTFVNMCDVDTEGEVIFKNVNRFIFEKDDTKRAYFSTLTKQDLVKAYEEAKPHLDFNLAEAGEARHSLDWLWGINLSRALTLSIKNATKSFKIMSSGRVQGPALYLLYQRELEIKKFKPEPYWEVSLCGKLKTTLIEAFHKKGIFKNKKDAEEIIKKTKGKEAFISSITKREIKQEPLLPFDLTSLQLEAYKTLGLSPKTTLEIAQNLYTGSYISYPRTSSQKLPKSIGYEEILKNLKKRFPTEVAFLLAKKELKPTEGKKDDPAHPAIFPTGELPGKLDPRAENVYELIVRRFFVCFGDPAIRESVTYEINCNDELFSLSGTTTKVKGWHELYGKFVKLKEEELPLAKEKDEIKTPKTKIYDKETTPPNRYSEASLIKELEKRNLGTKATRAEIISTLYDRNYAKEKSIEVTNLGMKTVETLEKYCPEILDENLTRTFEEEMEEIREGKIKKEKVLDGAKKALTKILDHFKENELKIGKLLAEANIETRIEESTLGPCHVCKKGNLELRKGKFGNFVACNQYPDCKTTFSLPSGFIKPAKQTCVKCGFPMVMIIKKAKRPQIMCINPECETRQADKETEKIVKDYESGKLKKECPNCKSPLIVRKGFYGYFLACPKYPKCKHAESLIVKIKE
ncbi:MAG: DNA topoisomerase I [Candidatus Nanoarchaeia archaeon]|nr:DNA topoisomerase I [Candidatus Nanoarchaeia archaeon]